MDEEKIEEYLKRQGISSMQESGPKKVVVSRMLLETEVWAALLSVWISQLEP
ncbi:hypothetical protein EI555_015655, partial [Monodon monoceros]